MLTAKILVHHSRRDLRSSLRLPVFFERMTEVQSSNNASIRPRNTYLASVTCARFVGVRSTIRIYQLPRSLVLYIII